MTVFAAVELGGMTIRVAIAEGTVENIVDRTTVRSGMGGRGGRG